jgi:tetratricopeptide (TPR) repeat protein
MRFAAAVFLASSLFLPPLAFADSDTDWNNCASDDADRIIAACDRIIAEGNERKVNFAIAYYNRGVGYQKKGDQAKAIADFSRSIKVNATDPKAFRARGNSYADIGEYDLAIADYTETIKLQPDFPGIYYDRGWACAQQPDYPRALNDYSRAVEVDANSADLIAEMPMPSLVSSIMPSPISTRRSR